MKTSTLRSALLGSAGLVVFVLPAFAQDSMETVTVTGYRASLADSTHAKRSAVGFSDTVFAEDIGKFPDSNIAESLNRIPGVTIVRDSNGEGVDVSIRGLGTNFTKVLLNGNPIAVASTGAVDAANGNREVDLNMFPSELFTQLSVSKSLTADQIEGGAAGDLSMRSMRPFDKEGFRVSYNLQLTDQTTTNLAIGKRGALIVSDTEGPFGMLIGISGVQSNMTVHGWEDGNAGDVAANLPGTSALSTGGTTGGACGTGNTCSQFGGGSWTIPGTVPAGVYVPIPTGFTLASGWTPNTVGGTNYFPSAYPVNNAMLYALNPGLADATCSPTSPTTTCLNQAMTRLSNTLLPRLGRPMFQKGTRDRYNAIVAVEFRPSDNLHFYLDTVGGRIFNDVNRTDVDWGVRGGASSQNMIPEGLQISPLWLKDTNTAGLGGTALQGKFHNAVYGLEARPYKEKGDFFNINPGMTWQATDLLKVDFQANYSRSHYFRSSPTVMVTTCMSTPPAAGISNCPNGAPSGGTLLTYTNTAVGQPPTQSINLDLNDPKNYEWNLGRVNQQAERRYTYTLGTHLDLTYGGDKFAVKVGAAYDEAYRLIVAIDDTVRWQNAICGNNPNVYLPSPNSALPGCTGQNTTSTPAGYSMPAYPGYGTGYSAGFPALAFQGSKVPTSSLINYLVPGPYGFVTVDYGKIFAASGFDAILNNAVQATRCVPKCAVTNPPFATASNNNALSGSFDERTTGLYGKVVGYFDIGDRRLKYDAGLRWIETRQQIISPSISTTDPRNASLTDGGKYPNYYTFVSAKGNYQAFLPSLSLVYEVADDFQVRASISRSMTRPLPGSMSATMNFSDPNVSQANLGNPNLKPYYSNNIDIGAELYTGGEGYIGMTLFRKSISGFTAQVSTTHPFSWMANYGITYASLNPQQVTNYAISGGPLGTPCNSDASCANQPITVLQQVNLPGLEIINGLEFDYVQPLDFLLEQYGLKGFGFNGNLTIIDQKSTGSVPTYATGVAPFQYNVTGYYENNGVMLRLSYNFNDRTYNSGSNAQNVCFPANSTGTHPVGCPGGAYLFGFAYGQADFSSSFQLSKLFGEIPSDPELTFDVQNVFSAKQKTYFQLPDALHTYYIKGQTYMVGLRGTF